MCHELFAIAVVCRDNLYCDNLVVGRAARVTGSSPLDLQLVVKADE
jgi:hypothetical protein